MTTQRTAARGYGSVHQASRKQWAPQVATGTVECWRCRELIEADAPWDLGHSDYSRDMYMGPEHRACNRGTARRRNADPPTMTIREW
jgi:hypothetical protein